MNQGPPGQESRQTSWNCCSLVDVGGSGAWIRKKRGRNDLLYYFRCLLGSPQLVPMTLCLAIQSQFGHETATHIRFRSFTPSFSDPPYVPSSSELICPRRGHIS